MTKIIYIIAFFLASTAAVAQGLIPPVPEQDTTVKTEDEVPISFEEEEVAEDEIFMIVETMPEFPGGELALRKYIAENIDYSSVPCQAQGRTYVRFVVGKNGKVRDAEIMRSAYPPLDEQIIEVIENMPYWTWNSRAKAVDVYYIVPVTINPYE